MSAKDLYKKLSRNKTSEELFSLSEQPDNTCPMIDNTIADLRSFRGQIGTLKFKLKEYVDLPSVGCHMKENITLLHQVISFQDQIIEWSKTYEKLEKELEVLRSYLASIRAAANQYKDNVWSSIDYSVEINEKDQTYSFKSWSRADRVVLKKDHNSVGEMIEEVKLFTALSFDEPMPECEECLIHGFKEEINKLIQIDPNIFSERPLDELLNKNYLEDWVTEVLSMSSKDAGESFISLLESHGFEKI